MAKEIEVRVIQWNISYMAKPDMVVDLLHKKIVEPCIVVLDEVTPDNYEVFKSLLANECKMEYSLSYRSPGKYDSRARHLGILVLIFGDITVNNAYVYERALYPDRTLIIEVKCEEHDLKILAAHSITGCDHLKSKSDQFLSLAECLDLIDPDIIMMDANEPYIDSFEIDKMVFFKRNGPGAKIVTDFIGCHKTAHI